MIKVISFENLKFAFSVRIFRRILQLIAATRQSCAVTDIYIDVGGKIIRKILV